VDVNTGMLSKRPVIMAVGDAEGRRTTPADAKFDVQVLNRHTPSGFSNKQKTAGNTKKGAAKRRVFLAKRSEGKALVGAQRHTEDFWEKNQRGGGGRGCGVWTGVGGDRAGVVWEKRICEVQATYTKEGCRCGGAGWSGWRNHH